MDNIEAWNQISQSVEATLEKMESRRRKSFGSSLWLSILSGLVLGGIGLYFGCGITLIILTFMFVFLVVLFVLLSHAFMALDKQYKEEMVPILLDAISPETVYDAKSGISEESLYASRIYSRGKTVLFAHEDGISGKFGDNEFVFSEVHFAYRPQDNVMNNVSFNGLAFEAKVPMDDNEDCMITTSLVSFEPSGDLRKVRLPNEDVSFGKVYEVYVTNAEMAERVMTIERQKALLELYHTVVDGMNESEITISLYGNHILVLIPSVRNRFEARILTRLKIDRVKEDFVVLSSLTKMVETLTA